MWDKTKNFWSLSLVQLSKVVARFFDSESSARFSDRVHVSLRAKLAPSFSSSRANDIEYRRLSMGQMPKMTSTRNKRIIQKSPETSKHQKCHQKCHEKFHEMPRGLEGRVALKFGERRGMDDTTTFTCTFFKTFKYQGIVANRSTF